LISTIISKTTAFTWIDDVFYLLSNKTSFPHVCYLPVLTTDPGGNLVCLQVIHYHNQVCIDHSRVSQIEYNNT